MCELFGYSAKLEERLSAFPEFEEFISHSKDNPDGWGIGWYAPDAGIIKEPISAADSIELLGLIVSDILVSYTLIAHLRHASVGEKTYNNTHPFTQEYDGRTWLFAHNGSIKNYEQLDCGPFVLCGTTDSEHIFGFILNYLSTTMGEESLRIAEAAAYLRSLGRCNFLLTDGKTLYAHADNVPKTKKLHYVERNDTVVVSTYPLTHEPWKRVPDGGVLVCREGKVVERLL